MAAASGSPATIFGVADDTERKFECRISRRAAIDDDGIDLGAGEQRGEMRGIGIRRQDGQAARHAVELDQRQAPWSIGSRSR